MSHFSDFEEPWQIVPDDPRGNDIAPLEKLLFDLVYDWGRLGVQVDYKAPIFQQLLNQIIALNSGKAPF